MIIHKSQVLRWRVPPRRCSTIYSTCFAQCYTGSNSEKLLLVETYIAFLFWKVGSRGLSTISGCSLKMQMPSLSFETEALKQHAFTQGWIDRKIIMNRLSQTSNNRNETKETHHAILWLQEQLQETCFRTQLFGDWGFKHHTGSQLAANYQSKNLQFLVMTRHHRNTRHPRCKKSWCSWTKCQVPN